MVVEDIAEHLVVDEVVGGVEVPAQQKQVLPILPFVYGEVVVDGGPVRIHVVVVHGVRHGHRVAHDVLDGLAVVVLEVFVDDGGGVAGDLPLGEEPREESLLAQVGHLSVEAFEIGPELRDLEVVEVLLHYGHPRRPLGDVHVLLVVVHEDGVGELPVEVLHRPVLDGQEGGGHGLLISPVGLELPSVVGIQPFIHGVEFDGGDPEGVGLVDLPCDPGELTHVAVYLVRHGGQVRAHGQRGDVEHDAQLLVEPVLVCGVVDLHAVFRQGPHTGIDHVERGLLLGHHQDGLPRYDGRGDEAGYDLGFPRSRRSLDDDLVLLGYGGKDVLLCAVEVVDIHEVPLGGLHPFLLELVEAQRQGVFRIEILLVEVFYEVGQGVVYLLSAQKRIEVPLDEVGVGRVLPQDRIVGQMHLPRKVAGELVGLVLPEC